MRTAIEQAGAGRGLLVLVSPKNEPRVAAEAATSGDVVHVQVGDAPITGAVLPEAVLHYALHTGESVVLDDAATEESFAADPYIRGGKVHSVLCLPMTNQAKLVGALYLENTLTSKAFSRRRISVLKLLASQAATALENTRLYRDLEQREAKIRHLVDANIIGIFIWNLEGRILEANDAFLRIVGYDREDVDRGRLSWKDLTPPEWVELDERRSMPKLHARSLPPFEKEYYRKDGGRVPVLIGAVSFEEDGAEGVAFVLDLTERKQSEKRIYESEQRYREVESALAHANRIATVGQLSASIAHEINQPIGAAVNNAYAASRWLGAEPPNIEEARKALGRIVKNGARAAEVIGRVRALVKRAPPQKDHLQINDAIQEVIALAQVETARNGVSVQTQFANGLPSVPGDRVQLQQVIMNLMMNAVEAMREGGASPRELLISTANTPADEVLVTVQDSGPGLDPSRLDRIFEAFYSTKRDGLGIGLSICRSIIEAHGGELRASPREPKGARFDFTLPARTEH
jgi:PAS domain S-box-containing protein